MLLASGAESVKIWQCNEAHTLSLVSKSLPFSHPVNCISWNHSNQVLAAACDQLKISLIQVNNGQLMSLVPFSNSLQATLQDPSSSYISSPADLEMYDKFNVKHVSFSGNSRFIACGIDKYLHLWDLKRKVIKFSSHMTAWYYSKYIVFH